MPPALDRLAFTLVELLVAITIIVVLLSLLAPAMDRAVYMAELAVCGSNLKGIALGGQLYATSFNRRYPNRLFVNKNSQPILLANASADDRPKFAGFIDLGLMVDPLAGKVRLSAADNPGTPSVFSSVSMWFGAQYAAVGPVTHEGMFKLGDRFTWTDTLSDPSNPTKHRFNVLACDRETVYDKAPDLQNSHPDSAGVMENLVLQSATWSAEVVQAGIGTGLDNTATITFAVWRARNTLKRGPTDMQFAYDDASVERFTLNSVADDTMARVPVWTSNGSYTDNWYMPLPVAPR